VQVVEDHHHRLLGGGPLEPVGDRVEQTKPGQCRLETGRRGQSRQPLGQLGKDLADHGGVTGEPRRQLLGWAFGHPCPGDLHPRPEAWRAVLLPGPAPKDLPAIRLRLLRQLAGKPALADAGLAGDQHELTLPAERAAQRGAQPRPLSVTADEGDAVGMLGALRHRRRRSSQVGVEEGNHALGSGQPS
jgi:hypothetical protein